MTAPTIVSPNLIYTRSQSRSTPELVVQVYGQQPRIYRLTRPQSEALRQQLTNICNDWSDA